MTSYSKQEKENFALISGKLILAKMLSALRATDKGPAFHIQEIKAQTEPEKLCEETSYIAGQICSEIYTKGIPDSKVDEMYSFAEKKGWEIHEGLTSVKISAREFLGRC